MSELKVSEFYIACRTGDLDAVEQLLMHLSFYDLNRIEPNGSTALHAAAFYEHINIVRRLVQHGALVRTLRNQYNLTPAQETRNEEIKQLLEPDAVHQPRKRFINDNDDYANNNEQTVTTFSTILFSPVPMISAGTPTEDEPTIDDEERLEWLDAYDSAHRIAQENHEYMRKWLTKIPLPSLLEAINNDYIDNPLTELTDDHRAEIRSYIELANCDDDPRHLVYAYTLETNFYRQLNRDLAQRGSNFRFEDYDAEKYRDDEPPHGFGQYLFTAVVIHHPVFTPFYYSGTTYRGMNLTQADFNQYVPGARILTRSFLSTSKSIHPVSYYLQFNSPGIVPVVCIYRTAVQSSSTTSLAIAGLSALPIEDEVLIFPFVAFRVVKVDFANFHFPEQGNATIMFLDQIIDQPRPWPLCGLKEQQEQLQVRRVSSDIVSPMIIRPELAKEIQHAYPQSIISLYKEHEQNTNQYIQYCLSLHSRLSCLHDLGIDMIKNIASGASSTDSSFMFAPKELEWLHSSINVNSLFLSLEPITHSVRRIPEEMDDLEFHYETSSKVNTMEIQHILRYERCCVIFGQPGAGKTTLARWIVLENAQAFATISNEDSPMEINEFRLPILVSFSDIAQALELHSNWTLIDCLCHPMWFEKEFVNGNNESQKNFLRHYICQQQAIIILDGLDEIIDTPRRNQIIELVDQFIQTYILGETIRVDQSTINPVHKVCGNQIMITSRWFTSFKNISIRKMPCYSLMPISFDDATHFIHRWFREIAPQISMNTAATTVDNWNHKAKDLIETLTVQKELQQLTSNSITLVGVCGLVTVRTLIAPTSPLDKRIVFYHFIACLIFHQTWKNAGSSMVPIRKESECFLMDMAAHIHQYSTFGLIEEFDIRLKCRSSFENKKTMRANRQIITDFLFRLSTNHIGLIVPSSSDLYRFLLPAFQQYFTCLSIVKSPTIDSTNQKSRIESVVNRVLYHITDSLYREPLLLTLSYISWQWTSSEVELFYEQLLNVDVVRFNRQLPLAAMLLMTALPELHPLPSMKVIYAAFNQFMSASASREWLTRFPIFIEHFVISLNNLPSPHAALWLTNYFNSNSDSISIRGIVRVLLQLIYQTRQIPLFLQSNQEPSIFTAVLQRQLFVDDDHKDDEDNVFAIDRLLTVISIFNCELLPTNDMRQYLLKSNVQIEEIPPSTLAAIIALYGGLHRLIEVPNEQCLDENVVFSPLHMHRTSLLTSLLIDRLNGKLCDLISLLEQRKPDDMSQDAIDLFVACLCLEGVHRPYMYQKFLTWPAFWQALARLRRLALYLSEYYYTRTDSNSLNDQHPLSYSIFQDTNQIIEQFTHSMSPNNEMSDTKLDLLSLMQSICSAICRLMYPARERSLFVSNNTLAIGMLNLPVSTEFQQLLMSDEYSSKTFTHRLVNLIQLGSPPFLPNHLHLDMDDPDEQQQFQYEIRVMLSYRHQTLFPLVLLSHPFQSLLACLFDTLPDGANKHHVSFPFACLLGEVTRTLLRRREGSARYHLLLAILRSHFEEHQLTNCFTGLIYTNAAPGLRSFFQPFDTYFAEQDQRLPFNLILDEEEQEDFLLHTTLPEQIQRIRESRRAHHGSDADNLKLYMNTISLAALMAAADQRRKDTRQTIVNDDEAIKTALLIEDPLLCLHALTIIWQFERTIPGHIERKWMSEVAFNLLSSAANYDETSLESHALIFLIFWSTFASFTPIHKSKQELIRVLDRLEMRLNSTTIQIEQAVCEMFEHAFDHNEFPFLRPRIYHFIQHSSWANRSDIVTQILGLRSPTLINCIRQYPSLQQKPSTVTLWASMYLMQLSIDANTLPMWFKHETMILNKTDESNSTEKEIVRLLEMSDQPEILTFEAATNIDQLLDENKTKATANYYLLEERLTRCSFVQTSALGIVAKWCDYRNHPYFCKFAYCAALLTVQRYPTSIAMEICCDLLRNDDDDFRQRSHQILPTIYQSSTRLGVQGLISLLKLALSCSRNHSALVYETISKIDLRIDSIETLEIVLRWERQRIAFLISTTTTDIIELEHGLQMERADLNTPLLQSLYVGLLIPDVRNQFFTNAAMECRKMLAMLDEIEGNDAQQEQELYLVELVLYASRYWRDVSPERMSSEENLFINNLIELLAEKYLHKLTILSKIIVKALIVNRADLPYIPRGTSSTARQCIKNILTRVAEENLVLSDDAIATMITHYYHGDIRFSIDTEEGMKLLIKLHSYKSSSTEITDATACALVRAQCFLSAFNTNLFDLLKLFNGSCLDLYRALIFLRDDSVTNMTILSITVELIKKYAELLFPLFIKELCQIVVKFNVQFSLWQPAIDSNHLKLAVSVINIMSPARFREEVRKRIDESIFKHALYCTSKQLDSKRRLACLQILTSLYNELTSEVHQMFYDAVWEKASDRQLSGTCVTNLRRVRDRSVVEELFVQLMNNKSRQRRYLAGVLLVQLARCDEISTLEVQRKLTEAIDGPLTMLDNGNIDLMKEMGNRITHEQLDRALFNLLMQLSFIPHQVSKHIINNDDYRVPDVTNFEAEFSRLVDADCHVSCISLPSDSTQDSIDD